MLLDWVPRESRTNQRNYRRYPSDPLGDVLACGRDLGRADQEIARASNSVDIARRMQLPDR